VLPAYVRATGHGRTCLVTLFDGGLYGVCLRLLGHKAAVRAVVIWFSHHVYYPPLPALDGWTKHLTSDTTVCTFKPSVIRTFFSILFCLTCIPVHSLPF